MSLEHSCTSPDNFPSLASRVARGTQRAQTPRWRRPIHCLGQGTLAGRLSRAIDVEDEEVVALSIPQSAWLFLFHERTSQQILQKEGSQGFDRSLVKRGEKAAGRRTCRQAG